MFLAMCGAVPATAALVATGVADSLDSHTIELPAGGPLDVGLPQTTTITARDGSILAEIDDVHYGRRIAVPLTAMTPDLVHATLAIEDRRYFDHPGVDAIGLLRALTENAGAGEAASGASTLEMQLVRNLFLADERSEQTVGRKMREAIAAVALNQRYSKKDLLQTYLNVVYYGNQAYGAEAAARRYFAKAAGELSLPEAALLAGLPQSPSSFDPFQHLDQAKLRQKDVLDWMAHEGFITPEQAAAAHAAPLELKTQEPPPRRAPHWVNYVRDLVRAHFGPEALFTEGLWVGTTIDPDIQALAERIVADNEAVRQQAHANNSAMVVIEPATGQILAMVGSKDFGNQSIDGQVNVAVAGRQPGSSIKPLVYLTGFEKGLNPAVEVLDQRTQFSAPPSQPPYMPANYDDKYFGRVTLRDALGNSLNVPAVKVLKYVGVPAFLDAARRLGISTLDDWDPHWLSLTLGGGEVRLLELTGAYATIARVGDHRPVEPFLTVETARGELLYDSSNGPLGEQVVDPRLAYQLLHVMGDTGARQATFGANTPLNLDRPHMVKTGTTDDYRDTWTVGCLPQVCIGVWMGNTDNRPMVKVSSSLTAGKIWVDMMRALIDRNKWAPQPFPRPDGLVVTRVPNVGNVRAGERDHEEVFVEGHEGRGFLDMDWKMPD